MQLRHFVSGSSVILAGWLAVTFFHQVPSQRYPKLEKYPTTSMHTPAAAATPAVVAKPSETFAVSASR
jgi:hypothetical protein